MSAFKMLTGLGMGWKIILNCILKKCGKLDSGKDMDYWRALVNAALNLHVP
jgi:hypothetical protein